MAERWIIIPEWEKFQHYKDRDPRWIKDYTRQLADHRYLGLSLRLRGILAGLRLLYAASGRDLGASPAQLGFMLGDSSVRMRDLESLSDAGLIVLSASRHTAVVASLDTETYTEKKPSASKRETSEAKASAEVALVLVLPESTQTLVAEYIDQAAGQGVTVPKRVIGQMAGSIKALLTEGFSPSDVRAGLARMAERRVVIPSNLANFVHEAALPATTPGFVSAASLLDPLRRQS